MDPYLEFEKKKKQLLAEFSAIKGNVSLAKKTSNLFRARTVKNKRISVKNFTSVLSIDKDNMIADVEGMITYEALVDETLKFSLLPTVVPQLKSITIGGAVSGLGIESSSFKYGLVHETVLELEILTGTGEVIICTPTNKYKDLFFGFPNSYGTLGYILRLKVKLIKTKPFVKLTHKKFSDSKKYFEYINSICTNKNLTEKNIKKDINSKEQIDFVDGTIFSSNELYATTATFVDTAPFKSNYKYMNIYYKSIKNKTVDYLSVKDYIWRWDTDWFWCSKTFGVQNPIVRIFAGPFLKSITYWKIMHFASKTQILTKLNSLSKKKTESVIQDVEIPIADATKFLEFFQKEIKITPVWICPTRAYKKDVKFDLYEMNSEVLYINFGFWDTVKTTYEQGYFNKRVEMTVELLNGKKSLYSDAYYTEEKFWELYNKKKYTFLKNKYDPKSRFKNLYEKTVMRN